MKRKFLTNLGFFLVLNLIIKPIYIFGIDRVVQNSVGAEEYGSFFSLLNAALIFQILLDLGIENFIRKEISQNNSRLDFYLSNLLVLKVILTIPYVIFCVLLAWFMGIHKAEIWLLALVLLNQFLASMILFFRANLGGLQMFKTESFISVLDRTLLIIIVGFLLLNPSTANNFRIIWFVQAQTFSYLAVILISFWLIFRQTTHFRLQLRRNTILPVLKKLQPYALLVLLMATYYRIDTLMLRGLLIDGKEQSGIYAHAFRILDFMSNYALLFPLLLLPIFSSLLQQKAKINSLLELSTFLLILPSVALIVPAIVYRTNLFELLYRGQIQVSSNVFAVLTVSYFGMCIGYTFGALLTANGNLKELNYMALGAVIISVVLNLILIPRYKVFGAAIANAGAQLFTIIVHILLVKKIFKLQLVGKTLLRLGLFTLCTALVTWLILQSKLPWQMGGILIFLLIMFGAFATQLISLKNLMLMVKKEKFS